jgi:UDPglucose 6-dehydrogenase
MRVTVIGTGYVGLVAGAAFSHGGHHVVCVDIDAAKIERLRGGELPIYEPGLEELVVAGVANGRLAFTTDTPAAVADADAVFIAVGTPPGEDGAADIRHVLAVGRAIGPHLRGYTVVVCKSTVPVGTCDRVDAVLRDVAGADYDVVSNPEFLREGCAIGDFLAPDRVVVGTMVDRARAVMAALYAPYLRSEDQLFWMDRRSAEMTKYAANCMLATRISFMNELSRVCEAAGVDIEHVRHGIGADARIGPRFLQAGIGYGGSCFPKDVQALLRTGQSVGCSMRILAAVEAVNADQKRLLADRLVAAFGESLDGRRVALLGLAFKPETDDMREAPSVVLADKLHRLGATVVGYDPVASDVARALIGPHLVLAPSWRDAVAGADAVLVVTEWHEIAAITPSELAAATDARFVLDGRNVWDPEAMRAAGFTYQGIGRGSVS